MKPYILDSALGTELENRGEYLPSFKTSIWSAYSLIHNPEIIKQIHIENIEAGADVITTANYQATPELLKREPSAPSYDDLAKKALELCQEAVSQTNTNTKIAGCFPPIHVTFRPDLSCVVKAHSDVGFSCQSCPRDQAGSHTRMPLACTGSCHHPCCGCTPSTPAPVS